MAEAATPTNAAEPGAVSGLILAGGQGRRMSGADKGLLVLLGEPMIEHVYRRFAPQVENVLISANRNHEVYAAYDARIVADVPALAGCGPLAGVATGLLHAPANWLAVVPCDTPWLPTDLVARLQKALRTEVRKLAVARTDRRRQSVCMLLHKTLLPDLMAFLHDGGRKVETWQDRIGAVEVLFDDAAAFANINTAADLAAAGDAT